jgi:hypothetical protein
MSASASYYFAPTYFSPFYFPPLFVVGGDPSGSTSAAFRDTDAYASVVAALKATGEFAQVFFGTNPDQRSAGADRTPAAVITPNGWAEIDDVDPVVIVRRVDFTLTVVARGEDALARYEDLDRLSCVCENAIDGSDLGGTCLPALTKLRRGRFEAHPNHPEQRVALHGEFTYLIPSMTGHKTSL